MTEPDIPMAPGERPPPPRLAIPTGIAWELPPAAPTEEDGDQLDGALAFGAAFTPSPGGFQPVPVVAIDGADVASGTVDGAIPDQVVVDGLTLRWGRAKVLDQPEPGTGSLTLFDATKTWAIGRQLIGKSVTVSWSGTIPGTGPDRRTFFRGRIQRVKVVAKTVHIGGRTVDGSLVTLQLVSIINDLANIKPTVAWPEETMDARRGRLAALAADVLPNGVLIRDYWKTPHAEPVSVTNQRSVYDHIIALYDSCGADKMTYWPVDQFVRNMPRRDYPSVRGLAGLWWNQPGEPTQPGRAGLGCYVRTYSLDVGGIVGTPHYLDAGAIEWDPADGLEQGPEQRISRVLVTNPDGAVAGYPDRRTLLLVPDVDERREGVRQASVDSIIVWNSWAEQMAGDVREVASQEGRAWSLPPVVWDTRRTEGFETWEQGRFYLIGGETNSIVFLQGSQLPQYGIRPVVGIRGSVTSYRRGHWWFELTLDPVVTTLPQHAITWEEIDDGSAEYEVQWWDGDHPHGMHESLTYEDLGYVSTGMGVVTIPVDTGWDREVK